MEDVQRGTEEQAQMAQAVKAQTAASRAARRAARLGMIAWGAAGGLLILLSGALATWVSNGWLSYAALCLVAFLSFRAAAWIERSGPVRVKPDRRVVLVTSALGMGVGLLLIFTVGPMVGSDIGAYAIGAASFFLCAGLLGAWWAGR